MTSNFPASLDVLPDIALTDHEDDSGKEHDIQHDNANDILETIEAKVGVDGSAVTTSLEYRVTNNLGKSLGLTGATSATRYVGGRASAAPTTGPFLAGDFVILQSGAIAICTAPGTPGTWVTLTASAAFGLTLADFIIYKSGSNYLARNTLTNADDFTSTNAGAVVQSAHDALAAGGLIELKSGVTYNATTMVTLSTAGVCVRSRPQAGEDQSTSWQLNSSLAAGSAAFRLTGSGAAIGGISVEINGNADYGIDLRSAGGMMFDANCKEANIANFYVDGPNGAARCIFWNLRSDNPTASGGINFKLDGPDHIAWGLRATGTATNGYALWMDTSRCQIASGHITGQGLAAGCVFISGSENRLSDFYMDSGPDGTHGQAHVTIKGSGNHLSALIQNAATRAPSPAVNVTGTALVSGTTYRFTTSSAHGLGASDAITLAGFGSSNGVFQSTSSASEVVASVFDATHFDVNLGVTTNFTDSVGTVTRTIVTVTGVALQSGTTYRFATASAHGYAVGDAVWLEGFASSSGAFLSTPNLNVLVTAVSDTTHFDADLGAATTFTDQVGTAKGITKYGLLFQKASAGSYVQGNELQLNFQGKGAGVNDGEFYYAVGFLDENGANATNFARFAANRITANAAKTTRFSNMEAAWGTTTNADKVFVDAWQYQNDLTTPMTWRTKAHGLTAAASGTTWTINHGLAGLPGDVQITARANPGGATWYVSSVTATTIVITASNIITNAQWAWEAEL